MVHAFRDTNVGQQLMSGLEHCPFMPVFGPPDVMFERGAGTQLWSTEGKRYLDFLSGIAVVSLGHANPSIARAISEQAQTLLHVSNFFANSVATETAIMINDLMKDAGAGDGQVFFCNSGAEANEVAIKLARKCGGHGRHVVVSALGSFHGRTLAALAMTGQPAKHEPFQPMPEGFRHVPYGDIDALVSALDASVAAVVLETVQGEGGVVPGDVQYLQKVQIACREREILFMVDEVQTGFCRTGAWFGFEHADLSPDAVMMAKGMGNGMPIGALWAKKSVAQSFVPGDHGSTYSGTALATAATRAVIREMKTIDAPRLATEKGQYITDKVSQFPEVDHVRGRGLLLGVQLRNKSAKDVYVQLLSKGLIVNAVNDVTLRLAPPITVTYDEIDEALDILASELS